MTVNTGEKKTGTLIPKWVQSLITKKTAFFSGKSDILELVLHAKNYFIAIVLLKALSFLTTPIITRWLSPADFGRMSIFLAMISLFVTFLDTGFKGAISRYYFEDKGDFNQYWGSNILGFIAVGSIILSVAFVFRLQFSLWANLPVFMFTSAAVVALLTCYKNYYFSYLQTIRKSKEYSVLSVTRDGFELLLFLGLLYFMRHTKEPSESRVYSQLVSTAIFVVIISALMWRHVSFSFRFRHLTYTYSYGMPLLPHAFSGVILTYFDRLMINKVSGNYQAGLYSMASTMGMMMYLIAQAMNQSWTPMFYEKMKNGDHDGILKLARRYTSLFYLLASGLVLFSNDIYRLMTSKSYHASANIVAVFIIGYAFLFLYTIYSNYAFYTKKTALISLSTMIATGVNVALNLILIPRFGYKAAAYASVASWIALFLLHYVNVRYILRQQCVPIGTVLKGLPLLVGCVAIMGLSPQVSSVWFIQFAVKTFLGCSVVAAYWLLFFRGVRSKPVVHGI